MNRSMTSEPAPTHFKNGFERFARGDLDGAITELDLALAADPKHVDALRTLAMAWLKKGDAARAVELGLRLTRDAPNDVLAWSSLSLFLMKCGKIQEAEDAAAKAKLLTWKQQLKDLKQGAPAAGAGGLTVLTEPKAPSPPQGPILPTIVSIAPPTKRPDAKPPAP